MVTNVILLGVISLVIIGVVLGAYYKMRSETPELNREDLVSFDQLLEKVKYNLADIVKDGVDLYSLDKDAFEAAYKRKARIITAMTNCVFGIDSAKIIVQDLILSVVKETLTSEEAIMNVVNFHDHYLSQHVKFEIMLAHHKKKYGKNALGHLLRKYNLYEERYEIEDKSQPSYVIFAEDIDDIYTKENIQLTRELMLEVITVLLYQKYKGFGVIDTIREMNINGINCGVSGQVLWAVSGGQGLTGKKILKAENSIWVQYEGRYIHFRFLAFDSPGEAQRVTQLICRYNSPGPLTEKRGFLVNTMYDKTRVLAIRPPAGEYWAFFLRKFTLSHNEIEFLLNPMGVLKGPDKKPILDAEGKEQKYYKHKNTHLPIKAIKYLMQGKVTCAFTGRQSSGKTTLMKSAIAPVDPRLNIRVLEIAPEMYLRELYPERNIYSVQETQYVTTSDLQDALKKADSALSIVGEVASDAIAARMIQMAQVASVFTIFSHHANTSEDLVYALRNSLVNSSGFTMLTAEQQVIQVIPINIHQDFDETGERFIDFIDQIIPLSENVPYPDWNDAVSEARNKFELDKEYYRRCTDRKTFETRRILHFNRITREYETDNLFNPALVKHILQELPDNKKNEFCDFLADNWKELAA